MFIKTILKTEKTTGIRYQYYRLCEGYRIEGKVRHRTILHLGKLEGITQARDKKFLADRIEEIIKGSNSLFPSDIPSAIENYAQEFSKKIIDNGLMDIKPKTKEKSVETDYQQVDINSLSHKESREIGSEWLCKQTIDKLALGEFLLEDCGFSQQSVNIALMHIISRAVYPASEHKTAQWIKANSTVASLCDIPIHKVNRHKLYTISKCLYEQKNKIELFLSKKSNDLFDLEDKIIFYDLTNTYFEGKKQDSKLAQFGRSKEMRKDAKLVSLAVVVNAEGFLKYSKIYRGNISESSTLERTIEDLSKNSSHTGRTPLIVMDAGIMTEDNAKMLKQKGYDYIAVSRTKLKNYKEISSDEKQTTVYDNRKNPIELKQVEKLGCEDTYVYVKSDKKAKKENSMKEGFTQRYETQLENINVALGKKGGTKKLDKVWERIGKLKEKYPTINKYYNIEVKTDEDRENATEIHWTKTETKSQLGVYFLRTNLKEKQESLVWTIYNTLTQIEATFRVLKTDLSLRPVFHQTDENTEAHLFLGLLAYQLVSSIRYQLKQKGIKHDWCNIIRIMNTQKEVYSTIKTKSGSTIQLKKCTRPTVQTKEIYTALSLKHKPYNIKKSVVP